MCVQERIVVTPMCVPPIQNGKKTRTHYLFLSNVKICKYNGESNCPGTLCHDHSGLENFARAGEINVTITKCVHQYDLKICFYHQVFRNRGQHKWLCGDGLVGLILKVLVVIHKLVLGEKTQDSPRTRSSCPRGRPPWRRTIKIRFVHVSSQGSPRFASYSPQMKPLELRCTRSRHWSHGCAVDGLRCELGHVPQHEQNPHRFNKDLGFEGKEFVGRR